MPYDWTKDTASDAPRARLQLWPHQSMTPQGFAVFVAATALMLTLPLLAALGTPVVWGLLLFFVPVMAGVWHAIMRNKRDHEIHEELTIEPARIALVHSPAHGPDKSWSANPYWVSVHMRPKGGPVENYLTLKGAEREVELGAFLTPDERVALKDDLEHELAALKTVHG